MMISILTLFPDMFTGPFDFSIVKRAKETGAVDINIVNIRDYAADRYRSVDDRPYGGGAGMILRVDVIDRALQSVIPAHAGIQNKNKLDPRFRGDETHTVLLDPRGTTFTQKMARKYATLDHLILVCGHYEGVDERVKSLVDESVSIGDYILTGGELPAMVICDSVTRLLPGVLKDEATQSESYSSPRTLEYPQYTRPDVYKGKRVPNVLLSGNHTAIRAWRAKQHPRGNS